MKKISIVIPAHNEAATLQKLVALVEQVKFNDGYEKELIIVNDGSTDSTFEIAKALATKYANIQVLDNPVNLGKTQTVCKGIAVSTGDYVVIQDADLEYDPNDLVTILEKAVHENLDFVYGDRFSGENAKIYHSYYLGNHFVTLVSNFFTFPRLKKSIPDMEVCYKLVRGDIMREIASKIKAKSNFGFEPELTAKLARYKKGGKHLNFGIVPIKYFPRTIEEGKHIRWTDGVKAIIEIIKYNLF